MESTRFMSYRENANDLISRLRTLALNANRGKRFILEGTNGKNVGCEGLPPYGPKYVVTTHDDHDAAYEVAVDPDTILTLLDRLEAAEKCTCKRTNS